MRTRTSFVTLAAAGLLAMSTAVPAAALTADDFGPIQTFGDTGAYPAIASGPADDSALVVYVGYNVDSDSDEVFGQFVDSELSPIGAPFLVSNTTDGDSANPPTAEWNPEGEEWLVVWEERNDSSNDNVVAARIVEPGTGAIGSQFVASDNHGSSPFDDMELAYSAYAPDQDVYLVAFKATVTLNSSCQAAFVSFVNADGTVPTLEATIVSTPDAAICADEIDNGANIDYSPASSVWLVGFGYGSGDTGVALVENVGGLPTVASTTTVGANGNVVHPSVDYDPTRDRFLLGWHYLDASFDQVFGALVDNAGAQVGAAFAVTPEDTRGNQRAPRVAYSAATDQFLLVNHNAALNDEQPFVGYWELSGATGSSASAAQVLSDPLIRSQRPDITVAGDCVLVVWQFEEQAGDTVDGIQGRSSCFTPELAATGTADATAAIGAAGALALMVGAAALIAVRRRATA